MNVQLKTWEEIDILMDTDIIALGQYAQDLTVFVRSLFGNVQELSTPDV